MNSENFQCFSSTVQSTDKMDTAQMTVFICRTDGTYCDGRTSYLSDTDRVRNRCRFVQRHQASPATQKVPAPLIAERNCGMSPLVTNKMYHDFKVLRRMTQRKLGYETLHPLLNPNPKLRTTSPHFQCS